MNYHATVKAITPEYVEIQEDQGPRKIEREGRTAKVAWVRNMPTTTAGASMAAGGLSPEARARLIAQGIDPQQAALARQAAMASMPGRARGMPEGAVAATPNVTPATRVIDVQGKASPMGSKRGSATGSATGALPNAAGTDKADSDNSAVKRDDSQPEIHR